MDYEIIKVRVISFAYSALAFFISIFASALASDDFRALVTAHLGTSIGGVVGLLLLDAVIKHLRNLKVLSDAEKEVGAGGPHTPFFLI